VAEHNGLPRSSILVIDTRSVPRRNRIRLVVLQNCLVCACHAAIRSRPFPSSCSLSKAATTSMSSARTYWQLIENEGRNGPNGGSGGGAMVNCTVPMAPSRLECACDPN
jgi:hypothetical protein